MKNWKQLNVMAIIAIVGIIMGFVACDNNSGDNDPKTFTVTFHANGGTPEPAQQTVDKNGKATEPPAMTKTNNDFDGWYKESAFTTQWIFTTNTVTANIDLYAKWTPYYGTLPNTTIKIYKGDPAVTVEQMTTALARIQTAYTQGIIAGHFEDDFQRIVKSINVTLGTDIVKKGNIVEFGCDATENGYLGTAFAMIAMGYDEW